MVEIHRLAQGAAYDPAMLDQLSTILNNVWTEVGSVFAGQAQNEIDEARNILAKALLYHSAKGHADPAVLKEVAVQTLAAAFPQVPLTAAGKQNAS